MKFSNKKKIFLAFEILLILIIPLSISRPYLSLLRACCDYSLLFDITFAAFYLLRIFALIHVLGIILRHFYYTVIKSAENVKKTNKKLLITAVISCFILGEIFFSFIPQNQGNTGVGLAQSIWYMYYYHPLNEAGYRDYQLNNRGKGLKTNVFFLGDSYTAGHGVNKFKDCYSSIISYKIDKNKFEIFNLGRGNSDTRDEFKRLKEFGIKPDFVILQYYHNDIEPVAKGYGHYKTRESTFFKKAFFFMAATISKSSFFINFIVVNGASKIINANISGNYRNEILAAYSDKNCLKEHLNDIDSIINFCRRNEIKLYVLFMPDLADVNFANTVYNKVKPLLVKNEIPFITLEEELKNYDPSDLTVGPIDNHANEFTQKIIAAKILKSVPEFH